MQSIETYPPATRQSAERTTGTVWTELLNEHDTFSRVQVVRAHFAPGARTCWHRHPFGQVLLVEAGRAWVQVEGEPVRAAHPGDTVVCPPDVWHWHGAAPGHTFTQLAVTRADDAGEYAVWGPLVTDEEYRSDTP